MKYIDPNEFIFRLWVRNYKTMYHHAYHQLRHPEWAMEAVQESFKTALEKKDKLRTHPKPDAWLMTTLNFICLRINIKEWSEFNAHMPPPVQDDPGLSELLPHDARADDVIILTSYYADRLSLAEIAARLDTTPAICKKRLYRARQRFKLFLTQDREVSP